MYKMTHAPIGLIAKKEHKSEEKISNCKFYLKILNHSFECLKLAIFDDGFVIKLLPCTLYQNVLCIEHLCWPLVEFLLQN